MAFFGQIQSHKARYDDQIACRTRWQMCYHGRCTKRSRLIFAARNEVFLQNRLHHRRIGEMRKCPPQIPTGVSELQITGQQEVQGRTGDNSQLSTLGNRFGQPPTGYSYSHTALNNRRQIFNHCGANAQFIANHKEDTESFYRQFNRKAPFAHHFGRKANFTRQLWEPQSPQTSQRNEHRPMQRSKPPPGSHLA